MILLYVVISLFLNIFQRQPYDLVRLPFSKYISKYISKEEVEFNKRCYGYTECYVLKRKIEAEEIEVLIKKFGGKIIVDDPFFTVYKLNNYTDFPANRVIFTDTG